MSTGSHSAQGTLGQAKELNRPILLVIGSPSCTVGRDLDRQTLADPEVAAYLDRNFVCVRIDGAAHPEWLNALLPFSRLRDPFWPDLQIWALDVVGHIFDFIGRPRDEDFSPTPFLSRLVGIRQEFADLGPSGVVSSKSLQHEDTQFLRPPRPNENPTGESARTEAIQKVSESFGLYSAVVRAIGERSEPGFR